MQRGKARESRSKGNPCVGQCSSNRAPGSRPRRRPRDGRDRAVGGCDGQERWGGFRGGTMPDGTE